MNGTYDDFLCRLKEQRKQLGLSQEQMAQRVHKTQSNYSKVELGLPDIVVVENMWIFLKEKHMRRFVVI